MALKSTNSTPPSDKENIYRLDYLKVSAAFLRHPIRNTFRFYLARTLRQAAFFSTSLQRKFGKSIEKRNFRTISEVLDTPEVLLETLVEQDMLDVPKSTPRTTQTFRHTQVPKRKNVLNAPWHAALITTLKGTGVKPDTDALPPLTLSFVTYNSERWLDGFFTSLMAQDFPLDKINVHFVDHGSQDGTLDRIAAFSETSGTRFASVTLTQRDNLGFGAGHDFVIRHSQDALVLVSNVDVSFNARSILDAVLAAQGDDADVASWELRQCPYEHPKYYDPVTLETSWSSHACILLRRSAYEDAGGYDHKIFMYGEDVELSYRLRGAGYRLRYLPHVFITHFVDFEDTTLRPNQLSGSLSSNVLLRYRYGGKAAGEAGDVMLNKLALTETDPQRRAALETAQEIVARNRDHFATTHLPKYSTDFPFREFDYDLVRTGFDVPLDSAVAMPDPPKVSIVTRTHGPNIALLRETIVSVLNQTYANIEHIIVEDRTCFAEDLVAEVALTYGVNIRYVHSDRTDGPGRSVAGNTGLDSASGALMMFLDNDDLLFCDHVETLVHTLHANPDHVAAYSLAWDTPVFYSPSGQYREGQPSIPTGHGQAFSKDRFKIGNFIPIQSILFRRALFDTHGGFDTEIDHLEDWNLWVRYTQSGDFVAVDKLTSLYKTPGDRVFREDRAVVMRAAEESVKKRTFPDMPDVTAS